MLLNPYFVDASMMPRAFRIENSVVKNGASHFARHSVDFIVYNSTFYDTSGFVINSKADMTANVISCTFIKLNTPLTITQGNINVSGATVFRDTSYGSALSSYQGSITLSGVILFLNNSADIRGGAMALYSSTLNIDANTVATFVNNSAAQLGGAIYISPGAVPIMVLHDTDRHCAYQLLNCSNNSKHEINFEGNSAKNGGDDMYGISLLDINNGCHGPIPCQLSTNGGDDVYGISLIDNDCLERKKVVQFNHQ